MVVQKSDIKDVVQFFESIIGNESKENLGIITSLDIQRYALSVGEENPLYYDKESARKRGYSDIVAPPNMIASVVDWGPGVKESLLHLDGTPTTESILPDHFKGIKIMGGGENMEFIKPITAGTDIILHSKVMDSYTKTGGKGLIAFLVSSNTFMDENGDKLAVCQRTIIAR